MEVISFEFISGQFALYQKNPTNVSEDWQQFFQALTEEDKRDLTITASLGGVISQDNDDSMSDAMIMGSKESISKPTKPLQSLSSTDIKVGIQLIQLRNAYRRLGHLKIQLDPIGYMIAKDPIALKLASYGLDPTHPIDGNLYGIPTAKTVGAYTNFLDAIYAQYIGFEFTHLNDETEYAWFVNVIEKLQTPFTPLNNEEKKAVLLDLAQTTAQGRYLDKKRLGMKRFGVDGIEMVIPTIRAIVAKSVTYGAQDVIMALAHRGRLNVLAHIVRKPLSIILNEFEKDPVNPMGGINGDVKYHLGWIQKDTKHYGQEVTLEILNNPSHLESIDPVLAGYVYGLRQSGRHSVGVMTHGDGAVIGQGIVAETLNLANIEGFETGGIVHMVLNNNLAYTARTNESRHTVYATDIAKGYEMPILHVNGENVDACIRAAQMVVDYREKFHKDIFLDIVGYRLHGHNEGDDPSFTNPRYYIQVNKHTPIFEQYVEKLKAEGVIQDDTKTILDSALSTFEKANKATESELKTANKSKLNRGIWDASREKIQKEVKGVSKDTLHRLASVLFQAKTDNFSMNKKLHRIMQGQLNAVLKNEAINWGTAELLAYGTLVEEGVSIRLVGEDSKRGTFSHRHAVFRDVNTAEPFIPLAQLKKSEKQYVQVINSPVTEGGVLGFEYGYSLVSPNTLTIWEAQFGDFSNGAQNIIDQYISSGESKWDTPSGLVMFLPHGMEGMGPEHSSARIERYLQLCAQDNMTVVNVSTPANWFHILRKHMNQGNNKPLIVFTPKSLLRLEESFSTLDTLTTKYAFQSVYGDADVAKARKVIFTSGKVYYDLKIHQKANHIKDVALIRLEQYYPFPMKEMEKVMQQYGKVDYCWVQEEPENNGAWNYLNPLFFYLQKKYGIAPVSYIGRPDMASPAVGIPAVHLAQQKQIVKETFK